MKRLIACLCLLVLLVGCTPARVSDDRLQIVVTLFPVYDWVRNLLGERADDVTLTLLTDSTDWHSYQPSSADMVLIANCDLFLHLGGSADAWATSALTSTPNPGRTALNLMEIMGDDRLPLDGHEHVFDEHIWLSLKNADKLCRAIADALSDLEPGLTAGQEHYLQKIHALDQQYQQTLRRAKGNTLVFADRYPFRYLAADYNLTCHAAFDGCSGETRADFDTVIRLATVLDQQQLSSVLILETRDSAIADAVIANTLSKNQSILVMDSMQSVTDLSTDYLTVMEKNLSVIQGALSCHA